MTAAALILIGFACAFWLTRYVEGVRPPLPAGYEDQDLALQGSRLKGFAFGAEGLAADWYWMNSLQYVGKKISSVGLENLNIDDMKSLNPRLLYPYLNNATELDPRFIPAYSYGATILPAIDPQQAIALTEKGIADNPNEWRLYQYLGYIYWRLGQYDKAAEVYAKGSEIPGVPSFMAMMAASMKTKGGSRDTAREIYRQLYNEAQEEGTRVTAEIRLMELDSLDERDGIRQSIAAFKEAAGRCPKNWSELIPQLQKIELPNGREFRIDRSNNPVDPSDAPYVLDLASCDVRLDEARTKMPLN